VLPAPPGNTPNKPIALALRWPAVAVDISTKGHTVDQLVARELREKYGLPHPDQAHRSYPGRR
jgi:hypothetical protein